MKLDNSTGRDTPTNIHIGRAEALEKRVAQIESQFEAISGVIFNLRDALDKKKSKGKNKV